MNQKSQKFLFLMTPFLLAGCVGSLISGNTSYLNDEYPDIRAVPERQEACAPRGTHEKEELASRDIEFKKLAEIRKNVNERDNALRKEAFSISQEKGLTPGGTDDF